MIIRGLKILTKDKDDTDSWSISGVNVDNIDYYFQNIITIGDEEKKTTEIWFKFSEVPIQILISVKEFESKIDASMGNRPKE